jgi:hypothetical protein
VSEGWGTSLGKSSEMRVPLTKGKKEITIGGTENSKWGGMATSHLL